MRTKIWTSTWAECRFCLGGRQCYDHRGERWLRFYSPPIIIVIIMLLQMGPKWEIHIGAAASLCNRDWMRIFVIHLWNRTLEIDSTPRDDHDPKVCLFRLPESKKKINEMGIDMLVSQMSGDLCIVSIHSLRMSNSYKPFKFSFLRRLRFLKCIQTTNSVWNAGCSNKFWTEKFKKLTMLKKIVKVCLHFT